MLRGLIQILLKNAQSRQRNAVFTSISYFANNKSDINDFEKCINEK